MAILVAVLFVAALVCFLLQAFSVPVTHVNLNGLGLFFLTLAFAVGTVKL